MADIPGIPEILSGNNAGRGYVHPVYLDGLYRIQTVK